MPEKSGGVRFFSLGGWLALVRFCSFWCVKSCQKVVKFKKYIIGGNEVRVILLAWLNTYVIIKKMFYFLHFKYLIDFFRKILLRYLLLVTQRNVI